MKKSILVLIILLSACTGAQPTAQVTETSIPPKATEPPPSPLPTESPTPEINEHRIAIRVVEGVGEFYDRQTGETFVPRGMNYIRLGRLPYNDGTYYTGHATFDPDQYDPNRADTALAEMHALGYNVVRVFIETAGISIVDSDNTLSDRYFDNVDDFVRLAHSHEMYVTFSTDWIPPIPRYFQYIDQATCCGQWEGGNAVHLSELGVKANKLFYSDVVTELLQRGTPMEAIFSFNLSNEMAFDGWGAPLNWNSGIVNLGNGQTYDMSLPADHRRLIEDGLVYHIDEVRAAILEVDPTALVGIGFFQPQEPHPTRIGDERLIFTRRAIWDSSADFIDLHAYPGDLSLDQLADNYEIDGMQEKPIIMGEFGAFDFIFDNPQQAAESLVAWQVESCQYGFDGWYLWLWDEEQNSQLFAATDGDGAIRDVLAPINRPDPCDYGSVPQNLARGGTYRVSSFYGGFPPELAFDSNPGTYWAATGPAPQWIQIELSQPSNITQITLLVAQPQPANTVHRILVGESSADLREVTTISGFTADSDLLVFTPETPLENIRVVRIHTLINPGWEVWREIMIMGYPGE